MAVRADNRQYDFIYGTPGLPNALGQTTNPTPVRKASSGGTVDLDGTTSTGVHSVDLNMVSPTVGGCGNKGLSLSPSVIYKYPNSPDLPDSPTPPPTPAPNAGLRSYTDWDKINMVFTPVTASQDGVVPRVDLPNINPNTNELKPRFLLHIQEAVNQLSLIPPPNPDGSTVFNTGSSVPLKFLLKDKNGNPVANARCDLHRSEGQHWPASRWCGCNIYL